MGRLRWMSWVLPVTAAMLLVSATTPAFAQRCKNLRLEVDPPNPDESNPVTVTVAAECNDTCPIVCDVSGEWIDPSEFNINWYIHDRWGTPDLGCLLAVVTRSSELPLGPLTGGEYQVTGTMHITPWDGTCTEGTVLDNVETTFRVDPVVPAVSEWGLVIMTLSMLAAGTIVLRRRVRYVAWCVTFMLTATVVGQEPDLSAPHHPERLLVRFKAGTSDQTRQLAHTAVNAVELKRYHRVSGLTLVKVPAERLAAALTAYFRRPAVLYAEPDYQGQLAGVPNDPRFDDLWGMHNTGQTGTPGADIRAVPAWDLWTGDPDFRIAVIDSGVWYDHDDFMDDDFLESNIWTNDLELNGTPGVDDDGNGYVDDIHGYDFVNDDGDPLDDSGPLWHGTHVAGTVGAFGNNFRDVVGVNWRCKIVALKWVAADGSGFTSDAVDAVQYCIDNDIKLSNNSWTIPAYSQCLYDVIAAAQAIGHIFVAGAANDDRNNDAIPRYPASFNLPNIIVVAATNSDDCLGRDFANSNYGPLSVDLGAPGVNVLSTIGESPWTGYISGTSMAAPHVTGVVALVMSQNPGWTWQQVRDQVLQTARPIPALEGFTVTGGVVNAVAALGDCNANQIPDDQELAGNDCNNNGTPDDCEPDEDCNINSTKSAS